MKTLLVYVNVALGSALGGVGRVWLTSLVTRQVGDFFPWGTLLVNMSGSILIGLLAALLTADSRVDPRYQPFIAQFFMAGICGGFTTFSAFSWQTLQLLQQGSLAQALWNVAASVLLCLAAVWLGYGAGRLLCS